MVVGNSILNVNSKQPGPHQQLSISLIWVVCLRWGSYSTKPVRPTVGFYMHKLGRESGRRPFRALSLSFLQPFAYAHSWSVWRCRKLRPVLLLTIKLLFWPPMALRLALCAKLPTQMLSSTKSDWQVETLRRMDSWPRPFSSCFSLFRLCHSSCLCLCVCG